MKILICGDRRWSDLEFIREVVSTLKDVEAIVHGDCRGADRMGGSVAETIGALEIKVPASWQHYGRGAGPIRNQKMLNDNPDIRLVLAFHDDFEKSKGTRNMVRISKQAGITIQIWRHGKNGQPEVRWIKSGGVFQNV